MIFILVFFFLFSQPAWAIDQAVILNEILPKPTDDIEWVEIYNQSEQTIDLTNWIIKDGNNNIADDLTLTGIIQPFSYLVFEHPKGWLNDTEDTITLLNNHEIVDSVSYRNPITAKTYSRNGDQWLDNTDPTKNVPNQLPSPSLVPSPSVSVSPNPSPSPTLKTIFQITHLPDQINTNDIFKINIVINSTPNTNFYLKGAFKHPDVSNYFGLTKVANSWIKNSETFTKQLLISTDASGSWSGEIEVKADPTDSGFKGTADYNFKVARYNSDGGLSWSNESPIKIIHEIPTPTPSSLPSPSKTTVTNSSPSPDQQVSASPMIKPTRTNHSTESTSSSLNFDTNQQATIAGIKTQINSQTVKSQNKFDLILIILGTIVILVSIIYGYLRYKHNWVKF